MHGRLQSVGWVLLLICVIGWFFRECLFRGFSLVPMDLLYQLMAPYNAGVSHISVQNHYTLDILDAYYGWGVFWQNSLRTGEIPLWLPHVFGGHPHLAVSMEAVFNPAKVLYFFLSAERAFSLGIVLEFMLAGVSMFAFLRELGRSHCASFVGSCAYALNSAFLMWYWGVPSTFAWAPLVLLLFERAVRKSSWGYALSSGLALGVAFLSGSIQAAAHLGFLCAGYFAVRVPWRNSEQRLRALGRIGVVLAVALLVFAVQGLPTLELLAQNPGRARSGGRLLWGVRHTVLGVPFLLTFLFPALAGSTETYDLAKAFGASMGDFTGYIGVVPFMLFLIGTMTNRDRRVRGLLITAAAVLVIIFFTPLVNWVYHRFFIVVVFVMAVAAAAGVDVVVNSSSDHRKIIRWTLVGMIGVCVVMALGLLIVGWIIQVNWGRLVVAGQNYVSRHATATTWTDRNDWLLERVPMFLQHYRLSNVVFWLPLAIIPCVALAWGAYNRRLMTRGVFCGVLVVLTVCDLTVLGRKLVPQVDLHQYPLYPPIKMIAAVQADHELFRVQPFVPKREYFMHDNLLLAYGLSTVSGADSLAPENLSLLPYYSVEGQFNSLLDLMNVKYLFTPDSVVLPADRFTLILESPGARLYRNKHCLPRIQFVPRWEVMPDRQAILRAMTAETFDPSQTVFIEQPPPRQFPGQSPAEVNANNQAVAQIKQYSARRVVTQVQCSQPGVLLLADTFYPGWRARLNGRETRLYRADYILKAVFIPAGESEVEFYYAPLSFRAGAAISLGTVICAALAGLWLVLCRRWQT